jgi:hypothetical protein
VAKRRADEAICEFLTVTPFYEIVLIIASRIRGKRGRGRDRDRNTLPHGGLRWFERDDFLIQLGVQHLGMKFRSPKQKSACLRAGKEVAPVGLDFRQGNTYSQNAALALPTDAHSHEQGHVDDVRADSDLLVTGIQEEIGHRAELSGPPAADSPSSFAAARET